MPPKVSYMGVKVWPADKGEKKKRWDPSSFSLLVVLPNPHLLIFFLIFLSSVSLKIPFSVTLDCLPVCHIVGKCFPAQQPE